MASNNTINSLENIVNSTEDMHEEEQESDSDESNGYNPNFNDEVVEAIQCMPASTEYIACINCMHPIAFSSDVIDVIMAVRHNDIPIAYVLPLYDRSLIRSFANIVKQSPIFWQTTVRCRNCSIMLTHSALTIYNILIDDYCHDDDCIILDAASVIFKQTD